MKKLLAVLAVLLVLTGCSTAPAADDDKTTVDTVSNASENLYAFAANGLDDDDLMNAINEHGGVTAILTTCADGTPNVGLFGYDMVKQGDEYIICVRMMTDQTSTNIDNGSEVVILYSNMENAFDDEGRTLPTTGARIYVEKMADQEAAEKLCLEIGLKGGDNAHLYAFVVKKVLPLG